MTTPGGLMAAEIAEQPARWRTLLADAGPELDAVLAGLRTDAPPRPPGSSRRASPTCV